MRKILALILATLMLLPLATPVSAEFKGACPYPIIRLHGNSADIADENGNIVYDFDYKPTKEELAKEVVDIAGPLFFKGVRTGDYSDYYDTLYGIYSDIYGNAKCDENGNPLAGSNSLRVIQGQEQYNLPSKSSYGFYECQFFYDWRIDPWECAERLKIFIDKVKASTRKDKVCIYSKCLGGTPVLAYLARYGSDDIDSVCFDSVVSNGCEMISDLFTARVYSDSETLTRLLEGDKKPLFSSFIGGDLTYETLMSLLHFLNSVGATDEILDFVTKDIAGTIGEGCISAYMRASYGTWPAYWSMVKTEDLELAKKVMFGEEGSELRQTYAGLIEKIDFLHEKVCSRIPEILQEVKASGTKVCIVAKYGFQLFPYVSDYEAPSDQWVSVKNAAFNATTSKLFEPFSDEYVEQQKALGLDGYISVDRQIDTSTCVLPDNTWIVKGASHEEWLTAIEEICYAVCSNAITDINSDPNLPQFLCYDRENDTVVPLTEDNMNCEDYKDIDPSTTDNMPKKERIFTRIKTLLVFLVNAVKLIFKVKADKEA